MQKGHVDEELATSQELVRGGNEQIWMKESTVKARKSVDAPHSVLKSRQKVAVQPKYEESPWR
jgi:hypothetical protein